MVYRPGKRGKAGGNRQKSGGHASKQVKAGWSSLKWSPVGHLLKPGGHPSKPGIKGVLSPKTGRDRWSPGKIGSSPLETGGRRVISPRNKWSPFCHPLQPCGHHQNRGENGYLHVSHTLGDTKEPRLSLLRDGPDVIFKKDSQEGQK